MLKIYHNPRCTKSREMLEILKEKGEQIEIIEYLKEVPSVDELRKVIGLLGIKPFELIRKGEPEYKDLYKGKVFSDDEWIKIMCDHPKLIERPIVIKNGKAAIGRPAQNVLDIL
jgi:arsenate reductase (glutaredoxin)